MEVEGELVEDEQDYFKNLNAEEALNTIDP